MTDFTTIADIPRIQARQRPNDIALWFEGRTTTYAQLDEASNRCANALIAAGVKPGDRVACMSKNDDEFFTYWMGAAKARACLAPVNWRLAPPEAAFVINDTDASVMICGQAFVDVLDTILADCPSLKHLIQVEPGHPRWPSLQGWIGKFPATDPGLKALDDDDVIQLYTSGTTGLPKGVQLTNQNYNVLFTCGVEAGWARYEVGDVLLAAMPLFHVAGCNLGALGLLQGTKVVVLREIDPVVILRLIPEHKVNHAFLAPVVINMVLQAPGCKETDFSSLRRIFYGASPISEAVLLAAKAQFGCSFTQLYGLTETIGGGCVLTPEDHDHRPDKLRACGQPWPGFEVRVRNGDTPAGVMEVGEIEIRSPGVMKGYWKRPEATAEAIDAEGWFKSGDAGYFDADGYLFIHDRVKDMIVTGGENVYPAEVENAVYSHPSVADAAVIGVPDDKWGEAVKAVVVLRPGFEADAAGIIAHCRGLIAGYKVPKSVDFAETLPRNPSGKVLRRELRKTFWEGRTRMVG
jgi:acyl-CoA synthetase (AMP-forming)/AMP-acid ligase II